MPATAKLYETGPYVQTFTATVLVCTPAGEQFAVQLDRTAFYPEGGGQPCDTGALGTALVTDVQEHGGVITHTVSAALPVGQTVEGRIDWARRRDHMEQHTGEHILSGHFAPPVWGGECGLSHRFPRGADGYERSADRRPAGRSRSPRPTR